MDTLKPPPASPISANHRGWSQLDNTPTSHTGQAPVLNYVVTSRPGTALPCASHSCNSNATTGVQE